MPKKEPVESVVPAEPWDKTEMAYSVIPPVDEDGNPEGAPPAEKAAATRTANALQAATPKEK
jgi:hypothetical protein